MEQVSLIPAIILNPLWVRFLKPTPPYLVYRTGKTCPIRVRLGQVLVGQAIFAISTHDIPRFLLLVTQSHNFPT